MITRKEYLSISGMSDLAGIVHRKYYAQFVTDKIIELIDQTFRQDLLVRYYQEDKSFNNIPLDRWDSLMPTLQRLVSSDLLRMVGETWSFSVSTCIAKEAAKQLALGETKLIPLGSL